MASYFTEREMQEREIHGGRHVTARSRGRNVAPVPIAVDWTCFGTAWDIENTLTVLYATYSHIEKLFIVIPRPPQSLPPDPLNGEDEGIQGKGGTRTCSRVFIPAPKEQNLVYQGRDVHWAYVKDRIYQILLDEDDGNVTDEDDYFNSRGFWTSLYTTLMMAGGSAGKCRHDDNQGNCRRRGGKSDRCSLPYISVIELSSFPEVLCDVEPVPLLTRDHLIRLWDEARTAAVRVFTEEGAEEQGEDNFVAPTAWNEEDEEDDGDNKNDRYDADDENEGDHDNCGHGQEDNGSNDETEDALSRQRQQDQTKVSSYLPDVHCGNTVIWS